MGVSDYVQSPQRVISLVARRASTTKYGIPMYIYIQALIHDNYGVMRSLLIFFIKSLIGIIIGTFIYTLYYMLYILNYKIIC